MTVDFVARAQKGDHAAFEQLCSVTVDALRAALEAENRSGALMKGQTA